MGFACSKSVMEDSTHDHGHTASTREHAQDATTLAHTMRADSRVSAQQAQRITSVYDNTSDGAIAQRLNDGFQDDDDYMSFREKFVQREKSLDFDSFWKARASDKEKKANAIIQEIKERDKRNVYDKAPHQEGHGGQLHPRFPGDHFLSNVDLINQTDLFKIARKMPKGAHLHIHFNACLLPHVLLDIAKGMDRMFITSDRPLVPDTAPSSGTPKATAFDKCEIQFSLRCTGKEDPGDIFSPAYQPRQTMPFAAFLTHFPQSLLRQTPEEWLISKLIFHAPEAHSLPQTAAGAWEKFNGRTRMMKGLFNYETAYRKYTRLCLEDFVRDNIQYAEIRPNFMTSNQLWRDDGRGPIDNWGIMEIIIEEVERFQEELRSSRSGKWFAGLRVIYCTPRSFCREQVGQALDECLEFKKKWPEWIAGFDLVGEEAAGHPLSTFIPEFLHFQRNCDSQGLSIPFLFHCGETLDMGSTVDANLYDALLLKAKRIGHGFALAKHPYVMQHMRARGVCLELCPISNEILGLTPRVGGHAMYELLANGVHCTVSSDNGTLFRSTLSHDFYQTMVGKADMTIWGWKQLILWSIEHACMEEHEMSDVLVKWERTWEDFLDWILKSMNMSCNRTDVSWMI